MLSFKVLTQENREELISEFSKELNKEELLLFSDIIGGFSDDEDTEFALAIFSGCVLVRVFDMGKYLFLYPYEISEAADVTLAISAISEYAVREEIPLVFSDVPRECITELLCFRHVDIDAESIDGESFRVKIKTECMLLDEIPQINAGRVKLSAISRDDISLYAKLSKLKNVNKYWGYDYSCDVTSPSDEYFYECASRDFSLGIAMSLAIRFEGTFCGEAVLYAFDGKGGAEFAIRLLPEFQGKGLGRCTVQALISLAEKIGLLSLCSVIMKENEKSIAMLDSVADIREELVGSYKYTIRI